MSKHHADVFALRVTSVVSTTRVDVDVEEDGGGFRIFKEKTAKRGKSGAGRVVVFTREADAKDR